MLRYIVALSGLVVACPMFVEFFPDPVDVPDQEGEFVEIRLDNGFTAESLFVQFEEKTPLRFAYPEGKRLLLSHGMPASENPDKGCVADSGFVGERDLNAGSTEVSSCEPRDGLVHLSLGSISLPNSRESMWRLWAGSCKDSVVIPQPKPGKSFQRVGLSDEWVIVPSSPGTANPNYEVDIEDCGLSYVTAEAGKNAARDRGWEISGWLTGCDAARMTVVYEDLFQRQNSNASVYDVSGFFRMEIPEVKSLLLHLSLPRDEAPENNTLDTLLILEGNSPLLISEIHHCPEEPVPEWVEIYNAAARPLALDKIRFCNRGGVFGASGDSLGPHESLIVTKDSAALRTHFGFSDVRLVQGSFGYLKNTEGSLTLCYGNAVVDSSWWNKSTVACPSGFSPLTMKADDSPGFIRRRDASVKQDPFQYKLSSRVLRRRGDPLHVKIENQENVSLKLLDSAGREMWRKSIPPTSGTWWIVPVQDYIPVGVGYVAISIGSYERVVGFVVRP